MSRVLAIAVVSFAALTTAATAAAQGYPVKPIRMIVPYTPGG